MEVGREKSCQSILSGRKTGNFAIEGLVSAKAKKAAVYQWVIPLCAYIGAEKTPEGEEEKVSHI